MNATQVVIAVGYGVLVLVSVAAAVWLIRSTAAHRRRPVDSERLVERESRYAWLVVAMLVGLLAATIFAIPYSDTSAEGGQIVQVRAFQFGWTTEPAAVKADQPVEFRIRSRDVAHGFGIYRGTRLIAQVQAPARRPGGGGEFGPEQRLVHTFTEPGEYEILCLEFCGFQHQKMRGKFTVER